jgi:uncharacterized membrane protein
MLVMPATGKGALGLIFPIPTWEDYLTLGFDEIRHYGATSVQVMRRLRAALVGRLNMVIERSPLDAEDPVMARQEGRQGLGLSRAPTK